MGTQCLFHWANGEFRDKFSPQEKCLENKQTESKIFLLNKVLRYKQKQVDPSTKTMKGIRRGHLRSEIPSQTQDTAG